MIAPKPKGVIDDIFRQAGYKTINEVRNLVRTAIIAESKAKLKTAKALQTKTRIEKIAEETKKAGVKRVNTPRKTNPTVSQQNKITTARSEYKNLLKKNANTTKTHTKATKAVQRHTALMSDARSRFPNEAAFRKALAEEKRNIQKIKGKVK